MLTKTKYIANTGGSGPKLPRIKPKAKLKGCKIGIDNVKTMAVI